MIMCARCTYPDVCLVIVADIPTGEISNSVLEMRGLFPSFDSHVHLLANFLQGSHGLPAGMLPVVSSPVQMAIPDHMRRYQAQADIDVALDRVIGNDAAKQSLNKVLWISMELPHLAATRRRSTNSVLVHGPTGYCKTMLARAAAKHFGHLPLFVVHADKLKEKIRRRTSETSSSAPMIAVPPSY